MATVTSDIPLEVVTESPKYNPLSRNVAEAQSENEENEGEEEEVKRRRRQRDDECCYSWSDDYGPDTPCDGCLILCCFSRASHQSQDTGGDWCPGDADCCSCECDDCGDCCDGCDGCDCDD